jgi:XapX domain-containing protein
MRPYLISLVVGLAVGIFYGLLKVRSPAPPAIALLGLLGMLVGEQLVPLAKSHGLWWQAHASSASIEFRNARTDVHSGHLSPPQGRSKDEPPART